MMDDSGRQARNEWRAQDITPLGQWKALVAAALLVSILLAGWRAAALWAAPPAQQEPVQVSLVEWAIEMPTELAAGPVTFEITNNGGVRHNLEIEGQGIEAVLEEDLRPGESGTLQVDLPPGEYHVYCPVGNHEGRGMELTLVVSGAAPAEQAQATPAAEEEASPTPAEEEEAAATPAAEEEATPAPEEEPSGVSVAQGAVAIPGGTLPGEPAIALVKVADGLVDPVNVVSARDGSGRLFVVERYGVIRIVTQDGQLLDEPFLDIQDQVLSAFLEQGLYDIEFHPNFAENGRFFVHFSELLRNGDGLVVEYRVSPDNPDQADPESARLILQIEQPWANHNGGELAFGPDGYLYIGSGDGGWEGDPLEAGQDLKTLLGKVLRIDVDVEDGRPYAIPDGNPFYQEQRLVQLFGIPEEEFARIHTEARPEIWAYGLRNPWKFQFDRETGDLYLPDVGQNHWEEINVQPADSPGGENYGWDTLMGSHCFPIEAESCDRIGVLPAVEYSHEGGNCAVVGIGVYRGTEFAALSGLYLAGDYCSGRVWGMAQAPEPTAEGAAWIFQELLDTDLMLTGAGEDEAGNLYVTSCQCTYESGPPQDNPPGALWRVVSADAVPEGAETAPVGEQAEGEQDAAAGEGDTVQVELVDGMIVMPEGLTAGPTTFVVANNGTIEHNFEIEGQGIDSVLEADLQPGETMNLEAELAPGEYRVYCPVDDHAAQGMELTLTVIEQE